MENMTNAETADECHRILQECERTAQFDHDLFKRGTSLLSICSQAERSVPFILDHEVVDLLARSFDRLLSSELKDPSNGASMLRLCNAVEDLAEHQQGKIACGSFFIPRIVRLVTSEIRDVALLRAAAESLSALIILSPNNQQLLFELTDSCQKLFTGLLPTAGDFTVQATIMEVFYRLSRRYPNVLAKCCKSKSLQSEMQLMLKKQKPDMSKDMRHLVNRLNESHGARKSVHTFALRKIELNDKDVSCSNEKWMDMSNDSYSANNHISFYTTEDLAQEGDAMFLVDIYFPNIAQILQPSDTGIQLQVEDCATSHAESFEKDPPPKSYYLEFHRKDMPLVKKYLVKRVQECIKKKCAGQVHKSSIGIMPGQAAAEMTKAQKLASVFCFSEELASKSEAKSGKTEDPIESFSTEAPRETRKETIQKNKRSAAPAEILTCKVKRSRHEADLDELVPPEPSETLPPPRTRLRASAGRDMKLQQGIQREGEKVQQLSTGIVTNGKAPTLSAAAVKDLGKGTLDDDGVSKVPRHTKERSLQGTDLISACPQNGKPEAASMPVEDRSCRKDSAALTWSRAANTPVEKSTGKGNKEDELVPSLLKSVEGAEVATPGKETKRALKPKMRVSSMEPAKGGGVRGKPMAMKSLDASNDTANKSKKDPREKYKDDCRSEGSLQRIRDILGDTNFGDGASEASELFRKRNDVETPKAPSPLDSKRRKSVEDLSFGFQRAQPEEMEDILSEFASPAHLGALDESEGGIPTPAPASPLEPLSPDALSNPVTPVAAPTPEKKRRRRFPTSQKQTQTVLDFMPPAPAFDDESSPEDTKTIMRLAQTFKKLKAKMRLQSSNKRNSIQQGAVEFIQKKLQDAEDKIAQDLSSSSSVLQQSSTQLQGNLEAQSKKIKSAYDTFCADLKRELEQYDRLYSQLEAVQGELKTLHGEQKSVHKELLAEAAQACESMIAESAKKLKAVDKDHKLWQQTRRLLDQTFQDVTTEWLQ